jgi:hypothetical protein
MGRPDIRDRVALTNGEFARLLDGVITPDGKASRTRKTQLLSQGVGIADAAVNAMPRRISGRSSVLGSPGSTDGWSLWV